MVENGQTHMVCIRVPLVLYEQLVRAKTEEGLTMTGMVCKCLRYALRDRDVTLAHRRSIERIKARREERRQKNSL
ncbi:MAG: hypothetical protein ACI4XW_09500 [Candidatus Spyradocola sp.]